MEIQKILDQLDEIIDKLEGDVSLDDSLKLFEQGISLTEKCVTALDNYKGKLTVLKDKLSKLENDN